MTNHQSDRRALIAGDNVYPPLAPPSRIIETYRSGYSDYLTLRHSDSDGTWSLALADVESWRSDFDAPRPPDRLDPGAGHRGLALSQELISRFDRLVYASGRPWSALLAKLVPVVEAWGYDLYVVGGAVRDILLGKDPQDVKDLDLAGTTPPDRMRRMIDGLINQNPEFARAGWRVNVSGEDVLHVSAGPLQYRRPGGRGGPTSSSFLQHCSLRQRYQRKPTRWYLGADLVADCTFRDVTLNALFYEPVHRVVHSPSRGFLEDLGLDPEGLARWSPEYGSLRSTVIRPIDLVTSADTPDKWALKGFARVAKSIHKFPDVDHTPVAGWWERHRGQIATELNATWKDRKERPLLVGHGHFVSYMRSFEVVVDDRLVELCQACGLPDDALDLLDIARAPRTHLGDVDSAVLQGWGLRTLEMIDGRLVVGEPVLSGAERITPANADAVLLPAIGGDGERIERDVSDGVVTVRAHVIDAPAGLFVEIDADGKPRSTEGDS